MKNIAFLFAITMMIASCGANDTNNTPEKKTDVKTTTPIKVETPKPAAKQKVMETPTADASGIVWVTDVNTAFKLSKKTGKPVFTFFTGKQWCGWCKRLVAEILSKPEFVKHANDNYIMLELDFPRRDRSKITPEMIELSRKFGVRGYPTVLMLDHKQNLLARTGYQRMTPEQYIQHIETMMASKS